MSRWQRPVCAPSGEPFGVAWRLHLEERCRDECLFELAGGIPAGATVCGGKGYNLARLARYGFRVPRGGVLPAGSPVSEIRQGLKQLGL